MYFRGSTKNRRGIAVFAALVFLASLAFGAPPIEATGYGSNVTPTVAPPQLQSSEVTSKGDVSLTFDKAMADPAKGAESQFEVIADETAVTVTAVEKTNTPEKIKLILETKVKSEQTITVAYTKSNDETIQIKTADGGLLESFGSVEVGSEPQPPVVIEEPVPAPELIDITGHWAEANIKQLVASGAISGYPDGAFKPNDNITRAEFATVLVKACKLENKSGKIFTDAANHWAKDYIATAAANWIITGYNDAVFGPNDLITREQMAVMIAKAAGLKTAVGGKTFADSAGISDWAKDAVAAAGENSIISGYPDNTFRPKANATRAEAVTIIIKAL